MIRSKKKKKYHPPGDGYAVFGLVLPEATFRQGLREPRRSFSLTPHVGLTSPYTSSLQQDEGHPGAPSRGYHGAPVCAGTSTVVCSRWVPVSGIVFGIHPPETGEHSTILSLGFVQNGEACAMVLRKQVWQVYIQPDPDFI